MLSYRPDNNWHESAVYLVENPDTHTYSIGSTQNNSTIDYPELFKDLELGKNENIFTRFYIINI